MYNWGMARLKNMPWATHGACGRPEDSSRKVFRALITGPPKPNFRLDSTTFYPYKQYSLSGSPPAVNGTVCIKITHLNKGFSWVLRCYGLALSACLFLWASALHKSSGSQGKSLGHVFTDAVSTQQPVSSAHSAVTLSYHVELAALTHGCQ